MQEIIVFMTVTVNESSRTAKEKGGRSRLNLMQLLNLA
jgi:hypothetical protein